MTTAAQNLLTELRVRQMITRAAGRRTRPRRKAVPVLGFPRGAQLAYFKLCNDLTATLRERVTTALAHDLPILRADPGALHRVVQLDAAARLDAAGDELLLFAIAPEDVLLGLQLRLRDIAGKISVFNRDALGRQLSAGLGVAVARSDDALMAPRVGLFVADNSRLLGGVVRQHLTDVAGIILRAARAGLLGSESGAGPDHPEVDQANHQSSQHGRAGPHASVAHEQHPERHVKALAHARSPVDQVFEDVATRADVAQSRALGVARDQVSTFNGELTKARHENLGIEEYVWITSRDERVRPDHEDLDGTTQRWDDPPVCNQKTGMVGHPAEDFNCRCTASPVLDDILAALGA